MPCMHFQLQGRSTPRREITFHVLLTSQPYSVRRARIDRGQGRSLFSANLGELSVGAAAEYVLPCFCRSVVGSDLRPSVSVAAGAAVAAAPRNNISRVVASYLVTRTRGCSAPSCPVAHSSSPLPLPPLLPAQRRFDPREKLTSSRSLVQF